MVVKLKKIKLKTAINKKASQIGRLYILKK